MIRAAKGDHGAFKLLYDHYAPFVWRIVYRTAGGDTQTAQEIVQETFVCIYRYLSSFDGTSSPGTWIYRIALNASNSFLSNQLRRRRSTVPLMNNLSATIPGPEEYDTREFVGRILDTLVPEDRFLLMAKEIDGLTYNDIAEISGKTSESLRTRMSRIKKRVNATFEIVPILIKEVA